MRVLLDTNVVLDVLVAREPHFGSAVRLMSLVDAGRVEGVVSATTITTIHCIATKTVGREAAGRYLRELLAIFDVAAVDRDVLLEALALDFADYEDAVLHAAARASAASAIVTRNIPDFGKATIPVLTPQELLAAVVGSSESVRPE